MLWDSLRSLPSRVIAFLSLTAGGITRRRIYIKVGGHAVTRDNSSVTRVISGLRAVTGEQICRDVP